MFFPVFCCVIPVKTDVTCSCSIVRRCRLTGVSMKSGIGIGWHDDRLNQHASSLIENGFRRFQAVCFFKKPAKPVF
jgi:hypothetical protein